MANSTKTFVQVDDAVGGTLRDISSYVHRFRWPRTADMLETTALSDTDKKFAAGLKDGDQVTIEGLWDNTATTGFVAVFGSSAVGEIRSLVFGSNSNTSGQEKISCETIIASIERSHGRGELVAFSITLQVTGAVTEGTF